MSLYTNFKEKKYRNQRVLDLKQRIITKTSYDAHLIKVITWESNAAIYNLFTCDFNFPI